METIRIIFLFFFGIGIVLSSKTHHTITAKKGVSGDEFGRAIAVSGDYMIVGSHLASITSSNGEKLKAAGVAYIFKRNETGGWKEQTKLTAKKGQKNGYFGRSVSICGRYAVVGSDGANNSTGLAYIFERDIITEKWKQKKKLNPSDGKEGYYFGYSTSITKEGYCIVGAYHSKNKKGEAYIYERNENGKWEEKTKLSAIHSHKNDYYGRSVAIDGSTAVVGAYKKEINGTVFIYQRESETENEGTWKFHSSIISNDGSSGEYFGRSIDISGNQLLIGAYRYESSSKPTNFDSGAAYFFEKDQTTDKFIQISKVEDPEGKKEDFFGFSVSISGNNAIIGSYGNDDLGNDAGKAFTYIKDESSNSWRIHHKLYSKKGEKNDFFGYSVAIDGNNVISGSYGHKKNKGAAYVMSFCPELSCSNGGIPNLHCTKCKNCNITCLGDGTPNFDCSYCEENHTPEDNSKLVGICVTLTVGFGFFFCCFFVGFIFVILFFIRKNGEPIGKIFQSINSQELEKQHLIRETPRLYSK